MADVTVSIGIATKGRRAIIERTILSIGRQSRLPDAIYVSACAPSDFPRVDHAGTLPLTFVESAAGLTLQRNAILDRAGETGLILFLDDDFVMHRDYLRNLAALFQAQDDIVSASGLVLADGATGPGLDHGAAMAQLEAYEMPAVPEIRPQVNAYGCNMSFRASTIAAHGLRFDEALPLYAWLEDVDFGARIAAYGKVVFASALVGAHLGTKAGKTSGRQLGYSQIANPLYLRGKRTIGARNAYHQIFRNVASNVARSFNPEPWCDRRGRLRGNAEALLDLLRYGRANPGKVNRMRPAQKD